MGLYLHTDKKPGDGLALTEWNTLSSALAGASSLTLALNNEKVGSGTTASSAKLEVNGTIKVSGSETEREIFFSDNGQIRSADNNHRILFRRAENILELREFGKIMFSAGAANGQETASMVIAASGNVGIGTSAPQKKLHVNGHVMIEGKNALEFGGNVLGKEGSAGTMGYELFTAGALDIVGAGAEHFQRKVKIWSEGGLEVTGDINTPGTLHQLSDGALKTNVVREEGILSRLMNLNVVNYNWRDRPDAERKPIGFIAQNVKAWFPSLVGEITDAETKETNLTLGYTGFGVLAVGAIQELKMEHDAKIAALEQEIARLKDKITGA